LLQVQNNHVGGLCPVFAVRPRKISIVLLSEADPLRPEQAQVEDVELLRAVQRGDETALALLYDRYRSILFGLILRILHSQPEAEDVLQDVFIQVWQRAANFDETRGKPFTWLVTMARSRAIDRLRVLNSRGRTVTEAAREVVDEVSDAVVDTMRSEQSAIVRSALAQLSEEQRRTLFLAYFEGLTQSEIAERLGEPLGTVKTRMRTGTIKLREILADKIKTLV
jgi:RNA polymerase sigma-70 factor (ECF subfamily)